MFLARDLSPFFQALEVDMIKLVKHRRCLAGGPDVECRCALGRATVAVGGSEGLSHAFVKKIAQGAFHALDRFLST